MQKIGEHLTKLVLNLMRLFFLFLFAYSDYFMFPKFKTRLVVVILEQTINTFSKSDKKIFDVWLPNRIISKAIKLMSN